ncbi:Metalloprotease family M20D [Phytophthora cinnamomi]|uniref:Metalloprotease family M20D n=1 Tax=Phytophthora cinnamomi TaxID=4785 RepID=UPI00355AB598|nr:Metalloprotease family M20D [Phytophthora cinnamomi]
MERRGVGKRLTDGQRVEILKLLDSGAVVSEADVARRYGVTRSAIWRLRRSGRDILERYQEGDLQSRDERRRGVKSRGDAQPMHAPSDSGPAPSRAAAPGAAAAAAAAAAATVFAVQSPTSRRPIPAATVVAAAPAQVMGDYRAEPPQQQQQQQTPIQSLEAVAPLVFMAAKAIGSVQSPGVVNWERVSGHEDDDFFEVVNDGISVLQPGSYQVNVDLQHSQPRQNYKLVFRVWHDKTLLGQCASPLRTKKEISLSLLEMRCQLPALAKLRVEFLAPGFAFHESRIVLRLVQ